MLSSTVLQCLSVGSKQQTASSSSSSKWTLAPSHGGLSVTRGTLCHTSDSPVTRGTLHPACQQVSPCPQCRLKDVKHQLLLSVVQATDSKLWNVAKAGLSCSQARFFPQFMPARALVEHAFVLTAIGQPSYVYIISFMSCDQALYTIWGIESWLSVSACNRQQALPAWALAASSKTHPTV